MKINSFKPSEPIALPALRGKIGDWSYYVTLMPFSEIASRVKLPKEIDSYEGENIKLGDWIQRELDSRRTKQIVDYLNQQPQRFFNSLILGIYGGMPAWQELDVSESSASEGKIDEVTLNYLGNTFGVLSLSGDERIFAIDGQHRAIGIREVLKNGSDLSSEEVPVIFVAHGTNEEGKVRTRRLFSTLNRYAKPVNKSEIIALSEDDNSAIITRILVDNYEKFSNKILFNKSRSININNSTDFSNIWVLYDIVQTLLTNKKTFGVSVSGFNAFRFGNQRISEEELKNQYNILIEVFDLVFDNIPSLRSYFETGHVDRSKPETSLLFRPIGQNILFGIIKISKEKGMLLEAINFFKKHDFNLSNPTWRSIFWNEETDTLNTEKSRQKYAALLILESIGIEVRRTGKDKEVYENFGIDPTSLI